MIANDDGLFMALIFAAFAAEEFGHKSAPIRRKDTAVGHNLTLVDAIAAPTQALASLQTAVAQLKSGASQ